LGCCGLFSVFPSFSGHFASVIAAKVAAPEASPIHVLPEVGSMNRDNIGDPDAMSF